MKACDIDDLLCMPARMAIMVSLTSRKEMTFTELGDDACKISLHLEFSMSNGLLGVAAGKLFNRVAVNLVTTVERRAHHLYG